MAYQAASIRDSRPGFTVLRLYERPVQNYAAGGLARAANTVQRAGRMGDDILIHINNQELEQMRKAWGEPSRNPLTGLPEYGFFSKLWNKIKKVVKAVAPIALSFIPGVGPALGAAFKAMGVAAKFIPLATKVATGLVGGAISGGKKGALAGALTGGLGGVSGSVSKALTGTLGSKVANVVGNALVSGGVSSVTGGKFGEGALGSVAGQIGQGALNKIMPTASTPNPTVGQNSSSADDGLSEIIPTASSHRIPDMIPGTNVPYATPSNNDIQGLARADAPTVPSPGFLQQAFSWVKDNPLVALTALQAVTSGGGGGGSSSAGGKPPELPASFTQSLAPYDLNRNRTTGPIDYYNYGQGPEQNFYSNNNVGSRAPAAPPPAQPTMIRNPYELPNFAQGGALGASSRYIKEGTGEHGRADNIEALLSENEYVIDAETVALLGDGNPDAGARKLDVMRESIRAHKGKKLAKGAISAPAKDAMSYLPMKKAGGGQVSDVDKRLTKMPDGSFLDKESYAKGIRRQYRRIPPNYGKASIAISGLAGIFDEGREIRRLSNINLGRDSERSYLRREYDDKVKGNNPSRTNPFVKKASGGRAK